MPFYIRKSFKFGPLRINLSKSGIGASAGTTGFRVGAGPKGRYLHAGRGGLYYRKSLNSEAEGEPEIVETRPEPSRPKDGLAHWIRSVFRGR